MPKIFISYRRADSQYVIDGIHTELCKHFPQEDVFLDVESIPLGIDFDTYLRKQIAAYDVVLAIIGPDWAQLMQDYAGKGDDFVRLEIENALQQNKILIPVLVKEAEMPDFTHLPESIQGLRRKNNTRIRRKPDLAGDVKRLAEGITRTLDMSTSILLSPFKETLPDVPLIEAKPLSPPPDTFMPSPFEWLHIPAGTVQLKTGGYVQNDQTRFAVDAFLMAKYPITNAQYGVFVAETNRKPKFWDNLDFVHSLQPVIGVTWNDAIVYCQWLSEKLRFTVTLPTEQQWQRAAQGDDNRLYPWGNSWDSSRCNNDVNQTGTSRTSHVDRYPSGESQFKVYDMAGNVWEWCLNEWRTGSLEASGENLPRVLRGGAWYYNDPGFFAVTHRHTDFGEGAYTSRGFRIVCNQSMLDM